MLRSSCNMQLSFSTGHPQVLPSSSCTANTANKSSTTKTALTSSQYQEFSHHQQNRQALLLPSNDRSRCSPGFWGTVSSCPPGVLYLWLQLLQNRHCWSEISLAPKRSHELRWHKLWWLQLTQAYKGKEDEKSLADMQSTSMEEDNTTCSGDMLPLIPSSSPSLIHRDKSVTKTLFLTLGQLYFCQHKAADISCWVLHMLGVACGEGLKAYF